MGSESRLGCDLMTAIQALGEQGFGVEGVHVHVRDRPPVEKHWSPMLLRHFLSLEDLRLVAVGIAQAEGLPTGTIWSSPTLTT
jgi:hypothetical protein